MQNLSVLTRGNTLRPQVLLLGGPNCYIKGMRDCWKYNIPKIWEERELPAARRRRSRRADQDAAERAVLRGARRDRIRQGRGRERRRVPRLGEARLVHHASAAKKRRRRRAATAAWQRTPTISQRSKSGIAHKKFIPTRFRPATWSRASSASTAARPPPRPCCCRKDKERRILAKSYQLSKGNPIEDTMEIFAKLEAQVRDQGATLKVLGVGTTGYAKDILKDVMGADAAIVETVAHTQAGLHFYDDMDVICDVGGQDIKIIILKNGRVKDFKLNTQCSAGNGYFLQSTAQGFGVSGRAVRRHGFWREGLSAVRLRLRGVHAVRHRRLPAPGLEAGRDHGWTVQRPAEEHLALRFADSEPVGDRPPLPAAGRHAVQSRGGEVAGRFHRIAVQGQGRASRKSSSTSTAAKPAPSARRSKPDVCGINGRKSTFIGLRPSRRSSITTTRDRKPRAATSARTSACARSSTSRRSVLNENGLPARRRRKVPLAAGAQRLIIATCEKGTVEDVNDMRRSRADSIR